MAKGNKYKKQNALKTRKTNPAFKDQDGASRAASIRREVLQKEVQEHAKNSGNGDQANPEEPISFVLTTTLHELQDKMKRQPEMYKDVLKTHLQTFQEKLEAFKENPAKKDDKLEDYCKFMAHVSGVYREDVADMLCHELIDLLQQYYAILNPSVRMSFVTSLKILRGKDVASPSLVLPVMLKLFRCEDKGLRKFLHAIIVSDLKKLNQNHKVCNINRKLQNFIFQMLQDPNETASKRALNVMIELYKRRVWNDEKTVNVIGEACLHDNPKVVTAACKFFLILNYDFDSDEEDSSEDEVKGDKIALLKQRKGSKMTKGREQKLEKAIKQEKRKQLRKSLVKFSTDFLPIDMIHDAQGFVERLFAKLKKSNDRYEVKLYMLRLTSRMIGRHKIQLLQFYPNLMRYLTAHSKDKIAEVFAMIIESCHDLVPPETLRPVIEKIISNFVTEYCHNQHITAGLNAVREILSRMPLALDESQIEYLCLYRTSKCKSVRAAAKSLINFFRDVCPELLPKTLRGRFSEIDETNALSTFVYGAERLNHDIDGAELLKKAEKLDGNINVAAERVLDDKALKKIKILKLKQGVQRVDRHGFRDETEKDTAAESAKTAVRDEYYHKMLELIKLQQLKTKIEEDGEQDYGDEEGEMEMEEGEMDMDDEEGEDQWIDEDEEQGEDEMVSDIPCLKNNEVISAKLTRALPIAEGENDEEVPQAIPIDDKNINYERSVEGSEVSDIDPDDYDSSDDSSEYDSDELDEYTTANPHGFVYADMLSTYQKTRKERITEMRATGKDDIRDKYKKKQNSKKIGKSEKVHKKNKPFMMVKQKKIQQLRDSIKPLNMHKNKTKTFFGHFRKATKQRLESKKQARK